VHTPDPTEQVEILVNGVPLEVDPLFKAAVLRAYRAAKEPLPREMTTNQAAEFLDVSRPFVIKLVKRGELPCRLVGQHRRIPTAALKEYREKMLQKATADLDEMSRLLQEANIYHELQGPPSKGP
jgi:excisionase family DNA binding protein